MRRKSEQGGSDVWIIAGVGACVLLFVLVAGGSIALYFVLRQDEPVARRNDEKAPPAKGMRPKVDKVTETGVLALKKARPGVRVEQ
jgi:hypothetical protein